MPSKKRRGKKPSPAKNLSPVSQNFEPQLPLFMEGHSVPPEVPFHFSPLDSQGKEIKGAAPPVFEVPLPISSEEELQNLVTNLGRCIEKIRTEPFEIKISQAEALNSIEDLPSSFQGQLTNLINQSRRALEKIQNTQKSSEILFECPVNFVRFSREAVEGQTDRAVIASEGHTYGESYLTTVLQKENESERFSPITRDILDPRVAVSNYDLESAADIILEADVLLKKLSEVFAGMQRVSDVMLEQALIKQNHEEKLQLTNPNIENMDAAEIVQYKLSVFSKILEKFKIIFKEMLEEQAKKNTEQQKKIALMQTQEYKSKQKKRVNSELTKEIQKQKEEIEKLKLVCAKEEKEIFELEDAQKKANSAKEDEELAAKKSEDQARQKLLKENEEQSKEIEKQAQRILELEKSFQEAKHVKPKKQLEPSTKFQIADSLSETANAQDQVSLKPALHLAAEKGQIEKVKEFLSPKADMNSVLRNCPQFFKDINSKASQEKKELLRMFEGVGQEEGAHELMEPAFPHHPEEERGKTTTAGCESHGLVASALGKFLASIADEKNGKQAGINFFEEDQLGNE